MSEMLGLAMDDLEDGYVRVRRKGGREDTAGMSAWGRTQLGRWLKERGHRPGWLFLDWNYSRVYRLLNQAAARAGISDFNIHAIRHARALDLRKSGLDWVDIGYALGHTNPLTTVRVYTRDRAEHRKELPEPALR